MSRNDLPDGLGGWQVVDATPQETSDGRAQRRGRSLGACDQHGRFFTGYYRCGPASVSAIKDGHVFHPFDTGFVFAEVNSDVVYHKKDKYGNMSPYKVDTTYVGQLIYTKAVGGTEPVNITHAYKHHEGEVASALGLKGGAV